MANARTAFNTSRDRARASITPIIKAVNHSIDNIIRILAENKEYLLAEAIKEAYYSGQRTPPADLGIPADTSVGKNLIAVADNKLVTTVQTLQNSLNELAKLEGATLQADPYKATYSEILGSIRASLNSIGGTMHEVGFTLAALEAAKKAEKIFQKANKTISSTVASGGGTFTAH